jgi:hypothetical protein
MSEALNTIAAVVTSGRADLETMPWAALRYQHTAAVRAALMEKYKPSTANKMLAALRGVLKECWRLGYMTGRLPPRRRRADHQGTDTAARACTGVW